MPSNQNLAFVFPGQGSQKVGMLSDFADSEIFKNTFTEASDALGYDLWDMVQNGSQEQLNMTEVTQPVLLASSVALWRLWREKGGSQPAYMAGHSLGEWSALVCAGVVDFCDALRLVRSRGKYMQEAVPAGEGAMAAIIGLGDEDVEAACAEVGSVDMVAPVNYNSPGQVVIAGVREAVEKAVVTCKSAGAKKAMLLAVSAPFHTSLMKPAADRLAVELDSVVFSAPKVPVIHNVSARVESDPAVIKSIMIEQIYTAVRWVGCVESLVAQGVAQVVECGPGRVLSGLSRRINREIESFSTETESALAKGLDGIQP
ncbi:MAG: [acyl-carrier-protein] S-malonyltransferase [Alteromonadaceae bacterium]|nr:MAG: [acyl-carrier-protein] S-malonyltransferase [Alteromonadaceae bacterium]